MTDALEPENPEPLDYAQIPDDFPLSEIASAIAGFQSKLALLECEGKFYVPGGTPAEVHSRWLQCEDSAKWLAEKCVKNQDGKYAHLQTIEILDQYCVRMLATFHGFSASEIRWILRRTAALLGWPVPAIASVEQQPPPRSG